MTDEDLRQIEELFVRFSAALRAELNEGLRTQGERFDAKIEEQGSEFRSALDAQGTELRSAIDAQSEDFQRWLGIQREAFQHDLSHVAEGHEMLAEKIDRLAHEMRARTDSLERRLDTHAANPHAPTSGGG